MMTPYDQHYPQSLPSGHAPAPNHVPVAYGSGTTAARNHFDMDLPVVFSKGEGINPLVNSASPLLVMMAQLVQSQDCGNVDQLRRELAIEIKHFEQKAKAAQIKEVTIMIARYVICAALDETILRLLQARNNLWARQTLLGIFHKDAGGGEKVFAILNRMLEDPAANRDMLELIAICLNLGFEGKYRVMQNGRAQLNSIKDNVSKRITVLRNFTTHPLAVDTQPIAAKNMPIIRINFRKVSLALAITLAVIYAGFSLVSYVVNKPTVNILKQIEQKTHTITVGSSTNV